MQHHRLASSLLPSLVAISLGSSTVSAQYSTDFEAPLYSPGPLENQDAWEPFGANYPRVVTAAQLSHELQNAGLNPADPVHSGDQAMLYTYNPPDESGVGGGLMRRRFTGLEEATDVIMEWWARPLTPGSTGSTIGFNQGNTFVGIQDDVDSGDGGRAAALRFGNWAVGGEGQPVVRSIDWATNNAPPGSPANVWVASGVEWEPDAWYNFAFHLDYDAKVYDLYINGTKANDEPIAFYRPTSKFAATVFVSRGTNQAGQIIDDLSVQAAPSGPLGDFDGDGDVDGADFLAWQQDPSVGDLSNWKAGFGASAAQVAAVPEPCSALLAASMALVLAGLNKKIV